MLVKWPVEYHKKKGAAGDLDDLVFMKAPEKKAPAVQPVLLELRQDGQPAAETYVPRNTLPAPALGLQLM